MRLRWLADAANDLENISDYLALNDPAVRHFTMVELYEGVQALREMPYRGRPGVRTGTRKLVFPRLPYIVTYRIVEQTVELLFIRHGSRKPLPS